MTPVMHSNMVKRDLKKEPKICGACVRVGELVDGWVGVHECQTHTQ